MLTKNKYFLIIIFSAIILLTVEGYAQGKNAPKKKDAAAKEAPQAADTTFTYDSKDRPDPFAALVSEDGRMLEPAARRKKAGEIEIEGIIYDERGSSYAVINSEVYKAGDTFGEYKIIAIHPKKIIFTKSGEEFEREFKKEE